MALDKILNVFFVISLYVILHLIVFFLQQALLLALVLSLLCY